MASIISQAARNVLPRVAQVASQAGLMTSGAIGFDRQPRAYTTKPPNLLEVIANVEGHHHYTNKSVVAVYIERNSSLVSEAGSVTVRGEVRSRGQVWATGDLDVGKLLNNTKAFTSGQLGVSKSVGHRSELAARRDIEIHGSVGTESKVESKQGSITIGGSVHSRAQIKAQENVTIEGNLGKFSHVLGEHINIGGYASRVARITVINGGSVNIKGNNHGAKITDERGAPVKPNSDKSGGWSR